MKGKKSKKNEENTVHPYDFSLKRDTKGTKSDAKPIRPDLMAAGMIKAHGLEKATQIVSPLTAESFKDGQGNPVTPNESSGYWKTVLQYLKRGTKNALAS